MTSVQPIHPVLKVNQLNIALENGTALVSDISFDVHAGEVLALVGESGSGKTTIAMALLAHTRAGARIESGTILIDNIDLLSLAPEKLRAIRGGLVSLVAQNPAMALNPLRTIGQHLHDVLKAHRPELNQHQRQPQVNAIIHDVGLPADQRFLDRFPHQLSGGQQQRILLGLAFILRPKLIVLDEPTTALDVSSQARILNTIRDLCKRYDAAAVYVSHDLAVVKQLADRVMVLYAGRIAEISPRSSLFTQPRHPYTYGLLEAIPDIALRRAPKPIPGQTAAPGHRGQGCAFAPRCFKASQACLHKQPSLLTLDEQHQLACLNTSVPLRLTQPDSLHNESLIQPEIANTLPILHMHQISAFYGKQPVLHDISLEVAIGECLAIVGQSGSGKTTLAKIMAGLNIAATGRINFIGAELPLRASYRAAEQRHKIQYIFQNPYQALNPRQTIKETLSAAAKHFFKLDHAATALMVAEVLGKVSLPEKVAQQYPRELSGGELQRVAIARALICQPKLLICDEITSALDVSVQANILELLQSLQQDGLAIIFVTHNLGVVRSIANRVMVLHQGSIIESGHVDQLLDHPTVDYTKRLIQDSPSLFAAA
ncbi:ABC transporter ATP-binding protein [Methylobacillus flagellatus]|uniref:ABC transporter ATP-binding protein n=1 Tax=Methylobacillus flagellatus TaxID=405 RepID=UPI0028541B0B|nr:ABC transporter ATP-binding protein [Methylobacillus flagellatus]MDR5172709.1 ABC transporter ATP-binding protein [Methylobacillus flagellatus]